MKKKLIEQLKEWGYNESIIDGIVDGIFCGLESENEYIKKSRLEKVLDAIQNTLNQN